MSLFGMETTESMPEVRLHQDDIQMTGVSMHAQILMLYCLRDGTPLSLKLSRRLTCFVVQLHFVIHGVSCPRLVCAHNCFGLVQEDGK